VLLRTRLVVVEALEVGADDGVGVAVVGVVGVGFADGSGLIGPCRSRGASVTVIDDAGFGASGATVGDGVGSGVVGTVTGVPSSGGGSSELPAAAAPGISSASAAMTDTNQGRRRSSLTRTPGTQRASL
jgi:hypothetical protein